MSFAPEFCLIIPVYNEEKRINLNEFDTFLNKNFTAKILFVNDGSTDSTHLILKELEAKFPAQIQVLSNQLNQGKSESIRQGMLLGFAEVDCPYFGYLDADLAVPLSDSILQINALQEQKRQIVFGTRSGEIHGEIKRSTLRKAMGLLFRIYFKTVFRFDVTDSQCGAKMFRKEVVPILYNQPFQTRWLSDIELLLRVQKHFELKPQELGTVILQIPVSRFTDVRGSKFTFRELIRTLADILRLSFIP